MKEKESENKSSPLSIIIASVCICLYLGALIFMAVKIYMHIDRQRDAALNEFGYIADLASSAGVQGFMGDSFIETIQNALNASRTLEGLIITGPYEAYAFEKHPGQAISMINNTHHFKNRFDFSRQLLYMPLRIQNLRNTNIEARSAAVDYGYVTYILKQSLLIVLGSLMLAFFTLLIQTLTEHSGNKRRIEEAYSDLDNSESTDEDSAGFLSELSSESTAKPSSALPAKHTPQEPTKRTQQEQSKRTPQEPAKRTPQEPVKRMPQEPETKISMLPARENRQEAQPAPRLFRELPPEVKTPAPVQELPQEAEIPAAPAQELAPEVKTTTPAKEQPQGLYSPRSNIGWEEYTEPRLDSELQRCATDEQDLVYMVMEFKNLNSLDENFYLNFADDAVLFFTMRDLIFEKGERGISILLPNIELDAAIAKANEFHDRCLNKYALKIRTDLCAGMSSRSGRLIDARRLMFEANEALQKAHSDPVSHIIAFRSDPEKYRTYIASRAQ